MTAHRNDHRPLVAHVVFRFDVGGLENGVVNLINRLPPDRYRHAVIALTEVTDFRCRISRDDVRFIALNKPAGQGLRVAWRMHRELSELQPAIVHTRNLAALEMCLPAAWAGVPVRIHGEHGWDTADPYGLARKPRWIRRAYRPFVHHYVALSGQLREYLIQAVGVAADRIAQIHNGVDTERFAPVGGGARCPIEGSPFNAPQLRVIGTVGRLQGIKDQLGLLRAFALALERAPPVAQPLRLAIAGDGPLRAEIESFVRERGLAGRVWLAGECRDVAQFMRGLDCFVLPSRAEGISNTILEAMASALPIVATDVGGNPELLEHRVSGLLVPAQDIDAMAAALLDQFTDPSAARQRAARARETARRRFSIHRMLEAYDALYQGALARRVCGRGRLTAWPPTA